MAESGTLHRYECACVLKRNNNREKMIRKVLSVVVGMVLAISSV